MRGRSWHSARRARFNTNIWIDKVRWARDLRLRRSKEPLALHSPQLSHGSLADVLFSTGQPHQLAL